MPRNKQDRQRVSKLQKHEITTLAEVWDLKPKEIRALIKEFEEIAGHQVQSRESIETYLRVKGYVRRDEEIPEDSSTPDLPPGDIFVNG